MWKPWKHIFNTDHHMYKHWGDAKNTAQSCEYKYYSWNGWVYDMKDTQICLDEDVESYCEKCGALNTVEVQHGFVHDEVFCRACREMLP